MLHWIKAQYDELLPFGRFFFGLGIISLAVAAGMTFKFGWSMSVLHAIGLGVLSIVASFLPEAAYRLHEDGIRGLAVIIGVLSVPLLAVEYFSHVGYTVGQRVGNVQQTSVQNAKYDDARDSLKSDRTNLEIWRKQLSDLQAQQPWVASVKAEGLRAEREAQQKAVDLEAARKGCKAKCQAEMAKLAEIDKRISAAEQAADLTKRIEATQRVIDSKTEVASKAEFESSPVVNQTAFVSKLVGWSLTPTAGTQEASQIGISASLALANVLLTPLCFLVAGRQRRKGLEVSETRVTLPSVTMPQATKTIVQREIVQRQNGRPMSIGEAIARGYTQIGHAAA